MTPASPQNAAADPRASCFLTANAGSGKTSTLVNRVARLLLAGARPERILCVTYTKAAAAEMQSRLFERLGHWAIADDDTLADDLNSIDETVHDLPRARALFARALETPGGLKIQTIHAFCEKLLRRFPLEADLSPAFQVLDDLVGARLSAEAVSALLTLDDPAWDVITKARDQLILKLKPQGFENLIAQFIRQNDALRERFSRLRETGDWQSHLCRGLGLDGVCTAKDCLDAYVQGLDMTAIEALGLSMSQTKGANNQKTGAKLLSVITHWKTGHFDIQAYYKCFFTNEGVFSQRTYSSGASESDKQQLHRLSETVPAILTQMKGAEIASNSVDALLLFSYFSGDYKKFKRREGALDFTDLINQTRQLLTDFDAAWVLFKLDGGLEHILVDEAQDTSQDQWTIVKALSGDFFSGHGAVDLPRTVFAVGDEKQSIYGFQGAQPDRFLDTGQYFSQKAHEAGAEFRAPDLVESWRSLPGILAFVDTVFHSANLSQALTFDANKVIVHAAKRKEAPGLVELWPRVAPIATTERTADDEEESALDDPGRSPPSRRLAQQIAATIAKEIASGRGIWTKGKNSVLRPMHAGDVLILVRKRDHLFEHIIRELKMAGVPVSGADRLRLADHIAFQDLRALLRFCLQPDDNLSLACVLRSPMCDLSEGDLFALAQPRGTSSLWSALRHHPQTDGPFADARSFLSWALTTSHALTAFDALSRVLNRRDQAGRSQRQRILMRLGEECDDVLDETLALALKGEGIGASGLSACLDLFEFRASEIKRDQEEGGHVVRVMTVHGSKGLEAPWVIVPAGPQFGARKDDPLVSGEDDHVYLCAGGKSAETEVIAKIRADKALKDDQESLRLFYVALTRARDRLTVCGYLGKRAAPEGNFPAWYGLAYDAFDQLNDVRHEEMALVVPFDDDEQTRTAIIRVFGQASALTSATSVVATSRVPLPAFATTLVAGADIETERWAAISQMGDEDREASERAPSPLDMTGSLGRYRRGNLIHKLFEILPDIAPDKRDEVATRYLARQPDLKDDQRSEMVDAVMTVLADSRFTEAFGPQSRPEVAIAGQVGTNSRGEALLLSGRIDRLVVMTDRVLIIDYKSNRPAPDRAEDAAIAYQRQMAGYVTLLRQIYPDRAVEAALLWTDGPKLTPLSEALVNLRLGEILLR